MGWREVATAWLCCVVLAAAGPALADDVGGDEGALAFDFAEPLLGDLRDPDAGLEDQAPLWDWADLEFLEALRTAMHKLGLREPLAGRRLAVALVDLTDRDAPRVASINGDEMMYAASLPKIAVLLAFFEKVSEGRLVIDDATRGRLTRMIRESSNGDTTALMHQVDKEYIARVLVSPRYRLYDPLHNGGLWAGKDYATAGLWRRDPLHNLSHAATAMQVARFYYLLENGRLVGGRASRQMKEILSDSAIEHKFVAGLRVVRPDAKVFRKAGTWRTYHSDGALVKRSDGVSYIAVALAESSQGGAWLPRIIMAMDDLMTRRAREYRRANPLRGLLY